MRIPTSENEIGYVYKIGYHKSGYWFMSIEDSYFFNTEQYHTVGKLMTFKEFKIRYPYRLDNEKYRTNILWDLYH